ncbi:MAG: hypothetical protein CR971_01060 [candidate division SR1 bacterium]|nr:MAG: hypothetical protein CR971_01060 [candidate division SR1 bacterium]
MEKSFPPLRVMFFLIGIGLLILGTQQTKQAEYIFLVYLAVASFVIGIVYPILKEGMKSFLGFKE